MLKFDACENLCGGRGNGGEGGKNKQSSSRTFFSQKKEKKAKESKGKEGKERKGKSFDIYFRTVDRCSLLDSPTFLFFFFHE